MSASTAHRTRVSHNGLAHATCSTARRVASALRTSRIALRTFPASRFLVLVSVSWRLGVPAADAPGGPTFRAVEIDAHVAIGYGVAAADVDGDARPDILLADKKQIVWYRNPGWEKFVIAEDLTTHDNVCLAAADLNSDGKAEIAVGAGWNPGDTVGSGAVFYLLPPADRTQRWKPLPLHHEPTVHRMRWISSPVGGSELVVVPLHGRGNQNARGVGVRILAYRMPANPRDQWRTELIDGSLHATHNFDLVRWSEPASDELLLAAKEGVFHFARNGTNWVSCQLPGVASTNGAGEVRAGRLPGGRRFVATIEPMHGNQLLLYLEPASDTGSWERRILDDSLKEGHALACGDVLGTGSDQILMGWRARNNDGKVGVKLYRPLDQTGKKWEQTLVDDNTVACEDLCLADLNQDGRLDIVAAGRATHNLKVFFSTSSSRRLGLADE